MRRGRGKKKRKSNDAPPASRVAAAPTSMTALNRVGGEKKKRGGHRGLFCGRQAPRSPRLEPARRGEKGGRTKPWPSLVHKISFGLGRVSAEKGRGGGGKGGRLFVAGTGGLSRSGDCLRSHVYARPVEVERKRGKRKRRRPSWPITFGGSSTGWGKTPQRLVGVLVLAGELERKREEEGGTRRCSVPTRSSLVERCTVAKKREMRETHPNQKDPRKREAKKTPQNTMSKKRKKEKRKDRRQPHWPRRRSP